MQTNETMKVIDKGVVSTENETLLNEYIDGSKIVSYEPRELMYPKLNSFYNISNQLSLEQFMSRPTRIAGGTIDTSSTSLFSLKLPSDILSAGNFSQKVYGYAGFKATVVLRFQVNASRFQQGRVIIYHHPQLQDKRYTFDAPELYRATQLPHAELDLGTETEVIFKIPYVTCTTHYNLIKASGPHGIVKGIMYSPLLVGAGSANLQYNLFVYFEDVQMDIPIAQSGDMEQSKSSGPVALGMRGISNSLKMISRGIPMLSSVFKPAAWISDVASKACDIFGWSKPIDVDKFSRMISFESGYDTNCDGMDTARSVALFSNPRVNVVSDYFNDDADQMSLAYIVQKKSYWKTFTWAAGNSVGDVLVELPASPWSYRGSNVTPAGFTTAYINGLTPLCYLSTMFQQYKGSVTFTFKFVKTEFHSGRLLIVWNPYGGISPTYAGFTNSVYCLRDVVDLRECNEFTFTAPYATTTGYTPVQEAYGGITIFVLTELTSPDTVASNISIIVEVAGAPDFEFSCPRSNAYVPRSIVNSEFIAVAQSGMNTDCVMPIGVGGSHINVDDYQTSLSCVGEKILSLKQLLMRTSLVGTQSLNATQNADNILSVDPFAVFGPSNGVNFGLNYPFKGKDIFSRICCMYNLMRGSVVLRVSSSIGAPFDIACASTEVTRVGGTLVAYGLQSSASSGVLQNSTFIGQLHSGYSVPTFQSLLVPQYNNLPARLIAPVAGVTSDATSVLPIYSNPVRVRIFNTDSGSNTINLYRQAADDFHLGYFTYAPSLWVECPFETP